MGEERKAGSQDSTALPYRTYITAYRGQFPPPRGALQAHKVTKIQGFAELTSGKLITFVSMNGKGPGRSLSTNSLLWALFIKPSIRTVRRQVGEDRAAEPDEAAAAVQRKGHLEA